MQTATITSKYQFTVPMAIVRRLGLKTGQKVVVSEEKGRVILTPSRKLVEELAGSLKMPKKWKNKNLDEIIESSKTEYFKKKA